jgi:hypothetical protein
VTCGPLECVLVCLCRTLTGESLIMKAQGHLDLHLGHEAHRLNDAPPSLGTNGNKLDDEYFLWRHEKTPWKRRLALTLPNVWP